MMSDHDRFKDFLPQGSNFELPSRAEMFTALSQLFQRYEQQATAEIMPTVRPEDIERVEKDIKDGELQPLFLPNKQPTDISGATSIRYDGLFDYRGGEMDGKYLVVNTTVYKEDKEGKYFHPDSNSDIALISIRIFVSPDAEEPPFWVYGDDYDTAATAAGVGEIGMVNYKDLLQQTGKTPAELTDDQCKAVMGALGHLGLNIQQMRGDLLGSRYDLPNGGG